MNKIDTNYSFLIKLVFFLLPAYGRRGIHLLKKHLMIGNLERFQDAQTVSMLLLEILTL